MKKVITILIIALAMILAFVKCYKCYSCIEKGDSFDMPYLDSQKVSFLSNSMQSLDFIIKKDVQLPPSEYCGPIGSQSYGDCNGTASATFKNNNDSLISIKIYYSAYSIGDEVGLPVFRNVIINNRRLVITKQKSYTPDEGGIVKELDSIKINNKLYSNVIEFAKSADSLNENECGYILYSKTCGIIKFSIKQLDQMEDWILKSK